MKIYFMKEKLDITQQVNFKKMFKTTIISFLLLFNLLLFINCSIDEEFTFEERIEGRWAFSGRTAFLIDGSSTRSLPIDVCEFETEFIFAEDGFLIYKDFIEKEVNDGTLDFCDENLQTSEGGVWNISSFEKLIITLSDTEDGSDIIIEPHSVDIPNQDELNIRYNEFEIAEDIVISYYVYHYFRIYN